MFEDYLIDIMDFSNHNKSHVYVCPSFLNNPGWNDLKLDLTLWTLFSQLTMIMHISTLY